MGNRSLKRKKRRDCIKKNLGRNLGNNSTLHGYPARELQSAICGRPCVTVQNSPGDSTHELPRLDVSRYRTNLNRISS